MLLLQHVRDLVLAINYTDTAAYNTVDAKNMPRYWCCLKCIQWNLWWRTVP